LRAAARQRRDAACGGERLLTADVVEFADQGGEAAALSHSAEHGPELRLEGQGGGVAGKVYRALDQHRLMALAKK
jgi:hypothetical protein